MKEFSFVVPRPKKYGAKITAIVEDYGTAKYKPMITSLLKNPPLVLPK